MRDCAGGPEEPPPRRPKMGTEDVLAIIALLVAIAMMVLLARMR